VVGNLLPPFAYFLRRTKFPLLVLFTPVIVLRALEPGNAITQYSHAAWTLQEGKLPGAVLALAQTVDGTLWIGTESGLIRFDGVTFGRWSPPAEGRFPIEYVQALAPGRDGSLWIGTLDGLAHLKDGRVTYYSTRHGSLDSAVSSILLDRHNSVWIAKAGFRSGGLCRVETDVLHCFDSAQGLPGRAIFSLLEDHQGNLWLGGSEGLYRWTGDAAQTYPLKESIPLISSIAQGENDEIIAANGINPLKHVVGSRLENYGIQPASEGVAIRVLLTDSDGALWIGTGSQGLLHVYKGHVDRYNHTDGLSSDTVLVLFEDREHNIWVGTDRGIDRFRALPVVTLSKREGLSRDTAGSVFTSRDGSVWVGTTAGLNRVRDRSITVYDTRDGLPSNEIQAIMEDHSGGLWVGTSAGLSFSRNGRFHSLELPNNEKIRSLAAVTEEPDGILWFSDVEHGLIESRDGHIEKLLPWSLFENKQAYALLGDPKREGLWLGFRQGGIAYYSGGKITRRFGPSDGLAPGMITDFHLDKAGTLWIAAEGGLSRLRDGKILTLTSANGLGCDRIHTVIEDDDEALWLNTACGLVRIAREDLSSWLRNPRGGLKTKLFGPADGMRVRTALSGYSSRSAKSADGRLWFPVLDAVAIVDPRHLPENRLAPPVQIEQFLADRKPYAIRPGLMLPPLTRDLQIDYTAFSFTAPEQVRFRYKLEGYDREWSTSDQRQAQYTNLAPRHYQFRVLAANKDGVWNEVGASIEFGIQPTFYQTSWFKWSCLAAFGALLWMSYQLRVRHVAAQISLRFEERLSERTRISRELHDTLLQNITGFALQLGGLSKTVTAPESAKERLLDLRRQAEQWLREARESVWDLRAPVSERQDLLEAMRIAGQRLTAGKQVRFHIAVSGAGRDASVKLQENLLRIVQEATRNAIQHGGARQIDVRISYRNPDGIRLQICDDGCGFNLEEASLKPGHWGLAMMRERAERVGADLKITSAPGQGAEIEVVIPHTK
jgi:ligand-binding sensor domain-containing protein/signal transduction histidine kinase